MTGSLSIAARAAYILRDNSTGLITKAAPALYPHQWSWDAAFNAIGLATVDLPRARLELDSLFAGQWRNGLLPHIVFDASADGYWPGPAQWELRAAQRGCDVGARDERDHRPAGARDRGRPHPGHRGAGRRRRGGAHPGLGRAPVPPAARLAPVPRQGPGRQGDRADHAVPRLGVGHRQLPPLGRAVRRRWRSGPAFPRTSARTRRTWRTPASGRPTGSTTATCG